MRWLRLCYWGLYGLIFKSRVEREIDDELRFHLRMLAAQKAERGAAPEQASSEAGCRLGRIDVVKEYCGDIKGGGLLETLLSDLRYGLRSLRRTPGLAAVAIVTLALGIGATTSMFSVVKAVLIRSLQFKDVDRLGQIGMTSRSRGDESYWIEYSDVLDFQRQCHSFESIAVQAFDIESLTGRDRPKALYGASVSSNAFPTLGVAPAIGRNFVESEDEPGRNHVIILSYDLWQKAFAGDPRVIGRHIALTGTLRGVAATDDFEIVGVMPSGFNFPLDIPSQVPLDTRQMAF
ncbi:MAG: ABC transporter permease, partial [Blastocatellia bacterium]